MWPTLDHGLLELDEDISEVSWSPDGVWLILRTAVGDDIHAIRPGVDSAPTVLVSSTFDERHPLVSPDGRWLAYTSNESGRDEVYLRPFPDVGDGRWQLSAAGGEEPLWSVPRHRGAFQNIHQMIQFSCQSQAWPTWSTLTSPADEISGRLTPTVNHF